VIGCGGVGLNVIQGAAVAGARQIIAVDLLQNKLGFAKTFGATHFVNPSQDDAFKAVMELTGGRGVDYAFEVISTAKTIELAFKLAVHAPSPVRLLNIGGGFGIPYFPGERPLDIAAVGANLARLMDGMARRLPQTRVVIELGRYLVGEAGIYVCRIIDRKISRGQVFLITDGGLHHHLAASGNFGQVIRKNYPVVVGNRVVGSKREVASVVGPLCTPLDLLADGMEMAEAEVGDLVVVFQSGAYGLTASPTAFLSHPAPAEILV